MSPKAKIKTDLKGADLSRRFEEQTTCDLGATMPTTRHLYFTVEWFQPAVNLASELGIEPSVSRTCKRQTQRENSEANGPDYSIRWSSQHWVRSEIFRPSTEGINGTASDSIIYRTGHRKHQRNARKFKFLQWRPTRPQHREARTTHVVIEMEELSLNMTH